MSRWIEISNKIKQRNLLELLTPQQQVAYDTLYQWLAYPQHVNLYGPIGSGKTMVAWALARATGGRHIPLPPQIKSVTNDTDIALVDNAPHREPDVRRLMADCNLMGFQRVVFITNRPVTLRLHRVELPLPTADDIEWVKKNISRLYFINTSDMPENPNFWDVMSNFAK